jgi:predicted neuraminidase
VRSYRPKYELWSDGSTKQRFIYLPPNTQIDTTNPDRWAFPQGTRLYKTFSIDGLRLETRVSEKNRTSRELRQLEVHSVRMERRPIRHHCRRSGWHAQRARHDA